MDSPHHVELRAPQGLQHAELRATRGLQHLETLKQRVAAFYASAPYIIDRFDDPGQNRHVIRLQARDPDDELAILAGEVAHALRCALDNAVYSLAAFALKSIPSNTKLQWPILEKVNPSFFEVQTAGLSQEARAIIESLQPYQLGAGAYKQHALWQLHKLDIIDKHRRIPMNQHGFEIKLPTIPRSLPIRHRDIGNGVEVSLPLGSEVYELHPEVPTLWFGDEREDVRVSVEGLRAMHSLITGKIFPRLTTCFR